METTENKKEVHVMHALTGLVKKLSDSELKPTKLRSTKAFSVRVGAFLEITENQAYMFAAIFSLQMDETHRLDVSDICRFLEISYLDILAYKSDFDILFEKKLVSEERYISSESDLPLKNYIFSISSRVLDALFLNEPVPELTYETEFNIYIFVKKVSDLIQSRKEKIISTGKLWREVELEESKCEHFPMIEKLKLMNLQLTDRTLFYEICNDLMNGGKTSINMTIADIYEDMKDRLKINRLMKEQKGKLFEFELIKLCEGAFYSDAAIEPTHKGLELFLEEDAELFVNKANQKDLIQPDKITEKELYYDNDLLQQVQFVQSSLQNDSFVSMQSRLESMGMPKGVAAIFYGAPGTGKTETVYQLAKSTGRSIMHVDISQTKSMWFGESEKKIKEIFTNYNNLCKKSDLKPILLFNEADAVFGKRKDSNSSNVAQTENAIQNIILEEMEKLEGILIATTNLNQNLDAAFERRFLFKVKFEKPSTEAKQKIWQSKLPWLQDSFASMLASDFSFSGGEIDNIVRKITMEEVLTGVKPEGEQIVQFCRNETFSTNDGRRSLGFH